MWYKYICICRGNGLSTHIYRFYFYYMGYEENNSFLNTLYNLYKYILDRLCCCAGQVILEFLG